MPKNWAALPRGGRSPLARVDIEKTHFVDQQNLGSKFCWSTKFEFQILLINKPVDRDYVKFCWSTKFWYHFLLINKIWTILFVDQHFGNFELSCHQPISSLDFHNFLRVLRLNHVDLLLLHRALRFDFWWWLEACHGIPANFFRGLGVRFQILNGPLVLL